MKEKKELMQKYSADSTNIFAIVQTHTLIERRF